MAFVAALAVVLAGCGTAAGIGHTPVTATTIGPPSLRSLAPHSPVATPAVSPGTTLTAADDGVTVSAVTGQQVTVELAPGPGVYAWDRPRLTGAALRLMSVTGGYPSRGPVRAILLAVTPGIAVVSTVSDAPCLHTRPRCSLAQRVWTARLIVRSSS